MKRRLNGTFRAGYFGWVGGSTFQRRIGLIQVLAAMQGALDPALVVRVLFLQFCNGHLDFPKLPLSDILLPSNVYD